MASQKRLVADTLRNIGLLTEKQLEDALRVQAETKERISKILLRQGYIASENIAAALTPQMGILPAKIAHLKASPELVKMIPLSLAYEHRIVPVKYKDGILTIAVDNPLNFLAQDFLASMLGYSLEGVLTSEAELLQALEQYYGKGEKAAQKGMEAEIKGISKSAEAAVGGGTKEEAPVIKLVSLLILEAFRKRASDIHLEPLKDKFRVRYRIDGVLNEVSGPPKRLQGSLISRIKIMGGLDIAEKRLPQDGRIRIKLEDKDIDLRVSTLPAIHGESVVLRILDKSSFLLGLKELGFFPEDGANFEKLIKMPNGIFLVTGPTGSGKTTTLYAALNHINTPEHKLITVEDPVEYQLSGVNQVQVKPQIGLTFAGGLRSMLRQAPDVIMVGEIRDNETASIAIQAALTGHLILSTLHTNDSAGAITRLVDMGIKPYLVASTIQGVLAQRLVRTICPQCKESYKPDQKELVPLGLDAEKTGNNKFFRGRGCEECTHTGYKGRLGIFELLLMTDKIRELIFEKASRTAIMSKARELGMTTLREDGIRKILAGITTISEVVRVTQND